MEDPARGLDGSSRPPRHVGQDLAIMEPMQMDVTTSGLDRLDFERASLLELVPFQHKVGCNAGTALSSKELVALGNIKYFCVVLLKKLAPPLLKEIEGARGVRSSQDPFMPRRTTGSVGVGG